MADEIIRILKDNDLRWKMSGSRPEMGGGERFSRERMVKDYYRLFQSVVHGA